MPPPKPPKAGATPEDDAPRLTPQSLLEELGLSIEDANARNSASSVPSARRTPQQRKSSGQVPKQPLPTRFPDPDPPTDLPPAFRAAAQARPIAPPPAPIAGKAPSTSHAAADTESSADTATKHPKLASAERSPFDEDTAASSRRLEARHRCSFPGIMKVLMPEVSFNPVTFAIRAADLSTNGALLELQGGMSIFDKVTNLANRHFEMKLAHPEIPVLRGTIAWSDLHRKPMGRLGVRFHVPMPELGHIFEVNGATVGGLDIAPLPIPTVDAIPPVVSTEDFEICGIAPEAEEIVVNGTNGLETAAPVIDGRFSIFVQLAPGKENLFSLRSRKGLRKSPRVPIAIAQQEDTTGTQFNLRIEQARGSEHKLNVKFSGMGPRAERILTHVARMVALGNNVGVSITITSPNPFEQRDLEALRLEGRRERPDEFVKDQLSRLMADF